MDKKPLLSSSNSDKTPSDTQSEASRKYIQNENKNIYLNKISTHLMKRFTVMLTGRPGVGKSSIKDLLAHGVQEEADNSMFGTNQEYKIVEARVKSEGLNIKKILKNKEPCLTILDNRGIDENIADTLKLMIEATFNRQVEINCIVWVLKNQRQDVLDKKFAHYFKKIVIKRYPHNYLIVITRCASSEKPYEVIKTLKDTYELPDEKKIIAIDNPDLTRTSKLIMDDNKKEKIRSFQLLVGKLIRYAPVRKYVKRNPCCCIII